MMKGKILVLILGLLCFASYLSAQEVTGNLEGRVLDPEGQPLGGVQVVVSGASLQGVREAKTDERGYFRFFSLPPGLYIFKAHHEAFLDISLENVRIRLGGTTSLGDIRLQQKVQEAREITVTAERPLINLTSTATGSDLVADTIKELPVGRDYRSVMALLPGANQSYYGDEVNVSGATGSENVYFIDGIDVSDPYMRYYNTSLPYNFVKEIEVKTGGYEAEYRSSLGGLVNVVTYSGGNTFSGQAFGFFTNNSFSQTALVPELQPSTGKFAQYDYGFSLGGPIVRDKLWFFGAFNPTNKTEDVLLPGLGYYQDKLTRYIFAGKLTWRPSSKANFVFATIGDPTEHNAIGTGYSSLTVVSVLNPDPLLNRVKEGGYNFVGRGNYTFSKNCFLEASLAYITRHEDWEPATERGKSEPFIYNYTGDVVSGGQGREVLGDSSQLTALFKGTMVLGNHMFKAGFEYRDNKLNSYANTNLLLIMGNNQYVVQTFNESGMNHNRIPSLFAQDSWSISDRLRLNMGLRWSGEFWVGSDGKVAQRIADEFQPRIGFILSPGPSASNKVFGSFGRYYQEASTYLLSTYYVEGAWFHWITYDHDPRLDPSGGTDLASGGAIQSQIKGLKGQNYDEFTLGYERALGRGYAFRVLGIYRNLRDGLEDVLNPQTGTFYLANPGRPPLENSPRMKREYYGLELTFMKSGGKSFNYTVSYTLSRSYGNYAGLFGQETKDNRPNTGGEFDSPEEIIHATGLLPNDRPHVFKFFGSYQFRFGVSVGAFFLWQSGTPLSELGTQQADEPGWIKYLNRGKAGRTPSISDLNLRISYQIGNFMRTRTAPRLVLDLFHIGSQRKPVFYEERHYLGVDASGNQIDPNPLYMQPTIFFPPMSARLGLEVNF